MGGVVVRQSGRRRTQGIYLVPDRQLTRAQHAPAGRTLHVVDVENLMSGPAGGALGMAHAIEGYRAVAAVAPGDHAILAADRALAVDAGLAWRTARLLIGSGPDGADLALLQSLADREWIAARYDRVVIGSGDGIFAVAAAEFRGYGIAVGVVAVEGSLAVRLRRAASFVRLLAPTPALRDVA